MCKEGVVEIFVPSRRKRSVTGSYPWQGCLKFGLGALLGLGADGIGAELPLSVRVPDELN